MSDGYFDRLERELRAAVPRAAARPGRARRPLRLSASSVTLAIGATVALVVAGLAVALLGHSHKTVAPATPKPAVTTTRAVPTLAQLLANFAVLDRPQTAADRSWQPQSPANARVLPRFTRLASTLPGGERIFLSVERFEKAPAGPPAGSYSLDIDIVSANGADTSTNFGPNVNYTVIPLSSPPPGLPRRARAGTATWASIIPDGVTRVDWTFACPRAGRCHGQRPLTVAVPVHENVAAASIPTTSLFCARSQVACRAWVASTWYSAGGQVVASRSPATKHNLTAPPFIKTNPTAPLPATVAAQTVLGGDRVASARFDQPHAAVIRELKALLGTPTTGYRGRREVSFGKPG